MNENDWSAHFANWFGDKDADAVESEWRNLKSRYSPGDEVSGTVVAKAPFGAWLDVDGFPALLEIVCIAGLTPEQYRTDNWCPIGSQVTGFVGGFRDDAHQIGIYQVQPGQGRQTT